MIEEYFEALFKKIDALASDQADQALREAQTAAHRSIPSFNKSYVPEYSEQDREDLRTEYKQKARDRLTQHFISVALDRNKSMSSMFSGTLGYLDSSPVLKIDG